MQMEIMISLLIVRRQNVVKEGIKWGWYLIDETKQYMQEIKPLAYHTMVLVDNCLHLSTCCQYMLVSYGYFLLQDNNAVFVMLSVGYGI